MRRFWQHGFYLSRATGSLVLAYARAAWYFETRAPADLALPASKSLDAPVKRRWKHYFFGTTFLATVCTSLRGRPRRRAEMRLFANLSALAGFFDDLVEVEVKNPKPGPRAEVQTPDLNDFGRIADPSGLALHLLENTRRLLPPADLPAFDHFLQRVFTVEIQGRQQNGLRQAPADGNLHSKDSGLNFEALKQITAEKGGCSVLLFRQALAHPVPEAEQHALFEFGTLVQLCDDIFDLWFDRQSGIATLATVLTQQHDPERLRQIFEDQVDAVRQAFRQMPYPKRRVETALGVVHFLFAITRVCLCHYIDLQKKRGTLPLDSRADMVVDMGRWRNRWRVGIEILGY